MIETGGGDIDAVTALATTLDALEEERRDAAVSLLRALEQVLRQS